ncbi:major_cap_HK97, phage major capsid protein, HK97 family [uncultured Caudovirales phage]|uniref:Major_cap_HK97, phage major capsid protein, HK97 family n=1 Tax=uncultured Caudovirales phage TaxID=2100421 RepID=A0A6J7W9N3_9CAUD|nr:major_cap_HK97, phage major capsid protein, HK97 family [uncultured Caudovirales phage]
MSITEKILNGIKQAITEGGKVTIDLREASAITGSGSGVGGNVVFDDAFAALRQANPLRQGSRQIAVNGSDAQFVAKTGNAANSTDPWGYDFTPNSGSPNVDTSIWQLPVRVLVAQLPIRTAVLSDVNALDSTLVEDLFLEFAQLEGESMVINDDQSGSTTTSTGATNGLRGLDSYISDTVSSYGTSGTAITNGIHSIATVSNGGVAVTYNKITNMANALPAQYWSLPSTAWHMSPAMIQTLRQLKDSQGLPLFLEIGDSDGAAVGRVFGWPVIPNPYLSTDFPIYLANWNRFLTIGDTEQMNVQMFEQTSPGFVTMFAEKRVVSTVRDPFAGVRMSAA